MLPSTTYIAAKFEVATSNGLGDAFTRKYIIRVPSTSYDICISKNSEYDQEIPQSRTADKPMAPRGRATQPS